MYGKTYARGMIMGMKSAHCVADLRESHRIYQSTYTQSCQLKFRERGDTRCILGLKFRIRLVMQ